MNKAYTITFYVDFRLEDNEYVRKILNLNRAQVEFNFGTFDVFHDDVTGCDKIEISFDHGYHAREYLMSEAHKKFVLLVVSTQALNRRETRKKEVPE